MNNSTSNRTYFESFESSPAPMTLLLSGVFAVMGFIGNIVVLLVYSKKDRKSSTDSLIIVLAANDLIACVTVIPMDVIIWIADSSQLGIFPCYFYSFYFFLFHGTYFTTLFFLISIAIERWLLVCYSYDLNTRLIRIKNVILIMLMMSVVLSAMSSCYCLGGESDLFTLVAIVPDYTTFFILPAAVISLSVMYTMIFRKIVKQDEFRAQLQETTICTPVKASQFDDLDDDRVPGSSGGHQGVKLSKWCRDSLQRLSGVKKEKRLPKLSSDESYRLDKARRSLPDQNSTTKAPNYQMKKMSDVIEIRETALGNMTNNAQSSITIDEPSVELAEHRSSVGRITFGAKRESLTAEEHFGGPQNSPGIFLTPKPRHSLGSVNRILSASDHDVSCVSSTLQIDYLAEERARKRKHMHQKQKAVALMLCMIAIVFLIGNSGNFLLLSGRLFNSLPAYLFENNYLSSLFTVAHHVPYAMNPIIYAIMSPKFRDEFREQTKNCPCIGRRPSSLA